MGFTKNSKEYFESSPSPLALAIVDIESCRISYIQANKEFCQQASIRFVSRHAGTGDTEHYTCIYNLNGKIIYSNDPLVPMEATGIKEWVKNLLNYLGFKR